MTRQFKMDMSYGFALECMKHGGFVQRKGWNEKEVFIFLIAEDAWDFTLDCADELLNDLTTLPFICMKTANNKLVPWTASPIDILTYDWREVDR